MASTTTSSSSAPARAAARSPTGSRRRASASCCSSAAATCRASRRTGTPTRSSARSATSPARVDRQGRRAVPPAPAVLRRRQHEVLRGDPVPPARARLRRGPPLRRRLAGVADLLRRPRAVLRRGRGALPRPRPGAARTRPSRRAPGRSRTRPSRTSRASSSCTTTSRAPATSPFHLPVGVDLNEADPEAGRCVRCDRFDGFPCLTDGKADAHVRCVRPALEHPNVTLRTHAQVERLETDASGRTVTGVVVDRRGARGAYSADVVVVSCGAANSAALLLRSADDRHPNGLANSSDQVGRNYMAHINSGVIAISQTPNETKFQKTLGLNDYYWGAEDSELPLGHIQMLGKSDRNILRAGAPWFAPGLALDYMAKHAIDFWLTTEDLPHPDNRVTVDRQGAIHLAKIYHNDGAAPAAARQAQGPARPHRLPRARIPRCVGARPAHPAGRHRAPVRHRALRRRPGDLGARRRLQGARPRQPLRRRHELLPLVERREPGADRDGERDARRRPPARAPRRDAPRSPTAPAPQEMVMKALTTAATAIGDGLVAGFAGTAAMTVSSTLEAKLRGRAASSAPPRARPPRCSASRSSRTTSRRRASTTSRTGATAPAGASCAALLGATGMPPGGRPRRTARRSTAARRSRCRRSRSRRRWCSGAEGGRDRRVPPRRLRGATGIAYELISRSRQRRETPAADARRRPAGAPGLDGVSARPRRRARAGADRPLYRALTPGRSQVRHVAGAVLSTTKLQVPAPRSRARAPGPAGRGDHRRQRRAPGPGPRAGRLGQDDPARRMACAGARRDRSRGCRSTPATTTLCGSSRARGGAADGGPGVGAQPSGTSRGRRASRASCCRR